MALTIQTQLNTIYGVTLDNAYCRIAVTNEFAGNQVYAAAEVFASQAAFEAGAQPLKVVGVTMNASSPYNYSSDERDILDLAHDIMITALAQQGVTAVKNL